MKDKELELEITVGTPNAQNIPQGEIWCAVFSSFFKILLCHSDFNDCELKISMSKLSKGEEKFIMIRANVDNDYVIDDIGHTLEDSVQYSAKISDMFTEGSKLIPQEDIESFTKDIPGLVMKFVKMVINKSETDEKDKEGEEWKSGDYDISKTFDSRRKRMGLDDNK